MQTIYLVPHTHYDVAWAFTRDEYLHINREIVKIALDMMETSNFKFCLEQTFLLEKLEEDDPELGSRLESAIKSGKLEIVDGQYLMPDTMLPGGEVLVREIQRGKRWCKERYGVDVPVAWASDSFGMNAQLPQIYLKSGYKWLAFRRGGHADLQESEFYWEGLDGSSILTHWFPLGYRAGLFLNEWEQSFDTLNKASATPNILMPCGSGSLPPQKEIPQAVENWNILHPRVLMKMATPREFFEALEAYPKKLQTVSGELYDDDVVDVFPQVCSSRAWIIQQSRECENLLATTEKFAAIAWLKGKDYPTAQLQELWDKELYIAFHDIITGTGVDEIYHEVAGILTEIRKGCRKLLDETLRFLSKDVSTGNNNLVVFNPLHRPVTNWATRPDGSGLLIDLPALGYRACPKSAEGSCKISEENIRVQENEIITPFWKIDVDDETAMVRIFDRSEALLVNGNELIIEDEVGDLYYHRSRFSSEVISTESGQGFQYGNFKPTSFKIEHSDEKATVSFDSEYYCLTWPYRLKDRFPPLVYKYKTLDVHKEIHVYRDIPRIEFSITINNQYPNTRLRIRFNTGIARRKYIRETQFGVIIEPTEYITRQGIRYSGIPNFQSWFDISNGVRGVAFMNKGLPACELHEKDVYITLYRSVSGLSADGMAGPMIPTPDALEMGQHTYEYAIEPHEGDWQKARLYCRAHEFVNKPIAVETGPKGSMPPVFSFLELEPDNLILSALKKAEDSDSLIMRFFETCGRSGTATVSLFRPVKRVTVVDLLEQETEQLEVNGTSFEMPVKAFEIVTLKLEF